jgi:hypothetical protein
MCPYVSIPAGGVGKALRVSFLIKALVKALLSSLGKALIKDMALLSPLIKALIKAPPGGARQLTLHMSLTNRADLQRDLSTWRCGSALFLSHL